MKITTAVFVLSSVLFACSKKSSNQALPGISMSDIVFQRTNANGNIRFYINLSDVSNNQPSINYTTVAGTAIAGTDFIAQSGTLSFSPGQKQVYIDIVITGDSLRRASQDFFVQLSDPQHCTLLSSKNKITIVNDGIYLPTDMSGYTTPMNYAGYNLIWNDEFDGTTLNTQNWNYETGGGGWGNNELENYTSRPQNVFVSNGNLVIEARQESYGGNNFTSARLTTADKRQFQFGRIDIRAKLPVAKGMWPALWMLGSNIQQVGWPGCGETDIMELVGTNPKEVVGSFHWKRQDGTHTYVSHSYDAPSEDFSQKFHVFSLIWKQDSLQILVDDQLYSAGGSQSLLNGPYPFNAPFFFIFNVAVGGDWPGPPDNTTVFPQHLFVDYIRVFR
ncbi:MAG: family 16 glycosylhydrolase [Bacteroidetes bacterium]|nr:family 16 glycosylhydrolase [Bacteroidota bacterium]